MCTSWSSREERVFTSWSSREERGVHTMGIWGGEGCAHHGHLGRRGVFTSWASKEERGVHTMVI